MIKKRRRMTILSLALVLVCLFLLPPMMAASPGGQAPAAVTATDHWDSGWVPLPAGICVTFTHNLGGNPDDYAVEVWFLDTNGGMGINRRGFGGLDLYGDREGAHGEELTANSIDVCRGTDDPAADRVRIRVWIPAASATSWTSPWTSIAQGQTKTFNHNLGVAPANLVVSVWFKGTARGIHQRGFGGLAINATEEMHGAHWHHLDANSVKVTRHQDDTEIDQVRVLVVAPDPPHYDSSFFPLGSGFNPVAHGLGWSPDMMLVRGECRSPGSGIHNWFAGGSADWFLGRQGVNIEQLARNSVVVMRWPQDGLCPEARIRIWKRAVPVYMPLIVFNN